MFKNAILSLLAATAFTTTLVSAKWVTKAELHAKQAEHAARIKANLPRRSVSAKTGVKNITFSNPRASGTDLTCQCILSSLT